MQRCKNYWKYDIGIYQHYKILDCYNLFRNDGISPLYIIRIRLDVSIRINIMELLSLFESNPNAQIIANWDLMAIGKPDIMKCYCTGLENNYGHISSYNASNLESPPIWQQRYHVLEKLQWTYAPESQVIEILYDYCNNNKLDIHEGIISKDMCSVIRHK